MNLVEYAHVFRDGQTWVVVETGMPQDNILVGVGVTLREAWESRSGTAIQSVGRDCGLADALEWACGAGWISSADLDEDTDAELEDEDEDEDEDGDGVETVEVA